MPERTAPPEARKAAEREQKSDRLAAALRANLARRKAQKRARGDAQDEDGKDGEQQG
jgi:hypothetical protein